MSSDDLSELLTTTTTTTTQAKMFPPSLWALVASVVLSLPLIPAQSTQASLSFDTLVTLTGNNFSTTSTPVLFTLPSSSAITISLALCAAASSNPPRVLVSNSTDSQVPPDSSGGPDVYEVMISNLGLGNLTLEFSEDAVGVLAVYGGTTSDSLEIGISQGGTQPFLRQLFLKLNPGHITS